MAIIIYDLLTSVKRIYLDAEVLNSGLVLVDLPGKFLWHIINIPTNFNRFP